MQISTMTIPLAAAALALGGCTTWDDDTLESAGTGAAIGAAAGAGVGAVTDVDVIEGAAAGAAAGGVIGAVAAGGREWYRDERGYCYYVDDGRRIYDYDRRDC